MHRLRGRGALGGQLCARLSCPVARPPPADLGQLALGGDFELDLQTAAGAAGATDIDGFTHDRRTRAVDDDAGHRLRSEEHTSELQSLMRISYAVFCLQKKQK